MANIGVLKGPGKELHCTILLQQVRLSLFLKVASEGRQKLLGNSIREGF